jgi:hypothetical protein
MAQIGSVAMSYVFYQIRFFISDDDGWFLKPFPLNPSFKPPPPISDKIRTQIFNSFMQEQKNESELSQSFGYSVSRIKAILRLKKLEQLWLKVRLIYSFHLYDEHQSISL